MSYRLENGWVVDDRGCRIPDTPYHRVAVQKYLEADARVTKELARCRSLGVHRNYPQLTDGGDTAFYAIFTGMMSFRGFLTPIQEYNLNLCLVDWYTYTNPKGSSQLLPEPNRDINLESLQHTLTTYIIPNGLVLEGSGIISNNWQYDDTINLSICVVENQLSIVRYYQGTEVAK